MQSKALLLSSGIRNEAVRLGFSRIGIAPVARLPWEDHFNKWLEKGWYGEMRYLHRQAQKRRNPGLILAGARSLLVLAVNYHTEHKFAKESLKGKISRYAWGDDYHGLIKSRLERMLRFIQSQEPSAEGLSYVDTGPVMEKVWGAQTALGWMGKHTNLISRALGSWFFIGVVLLNIELEYDHQEKDYCGICSRCIEACPTQAIVAPYVLDARRCISYLTIESRRAIPRALRPLMGNRIFGCDDCQEVCPWNRFAIAVPDKEFHVDERNQMPNLLALARISDEEFKNRYKNSPILRATRKGFVRNVAVALGNSGSSEAIPVLGETLKDDSALVRAHAAWALGRIATSGARRMLESARTREKTASVLDEIVSALGR
jgi:epoxyqueuosine reductase